MRVIPRDLFNEANLLKCLGKFWIETERFQPERIIIEHDTDPFDVQQNEDSGSIYVSNILITIRGKRYNASRPLNSRSPWPLYLENADGTGETIAVFTDDGKLTAEMLALLEG
jgi:hypothetical protein